MARFIPPENVLRFRHGKGWSIRRADASADVGGFKTIQIPGSIDHQSLVDNDLAMLLESVLGFVEDFNRQNEELMVETTMAAAQSSGNEVSAPESGSWPEAFLASLEKIKLSVDQHGEVSMPQIIVHPETADEMRAELESQGPDYQRKVNALLSQKVEEARREELVRLSNYEGFDAPA